MKTLSNERGVVMVAALGIVAALAGLSLMVTSSGQMSTLNAALGAQAARAFNLTDGSVYFSLGETENFVPDGPIRVVNHQVTDLQLDATVTASADGYRLLPGNLLIRTTDGKVRAAQFGQGEGLGRMYHFRLDAQKNLEGEGLNPASRVRMQAAKPGPCADCGS